MSPEAKINNSEPSRLKLLDKRNKCTKFQLPQSGINIKNACYKKKIRNGTRPYPGLRHVVSHGGVQPGLSKNVTKGVIIYIGYSKKLRNGGVQPGLSKNVTKGVIIYIGYSKKLQS